MYDPELYREKSEVEAWKKRDPLTLLRPQLEQLGVVDDEILASMDREVEAEIDAAVEFAEAGTLEPLDQLTRFVYSDSRVMTATKASVRTTYREAMHDALRDALLRDERVFLMGEDVGRYGGCFAVSKGLLEEFGPDRVRDTPLSESAFVGAGIGATLGGMRPIVEVMTVNFSLLALDQIVNNAATLQHMSGGQLNVPIVIRMTTGAGRQLAAQHSHSLEGWYRARTRYQGAHARHARGCPRHAVDRARGPRPRADLRARRALQRGGRSRVRRRCRRHRASRCTPPRFRRVDHHVRRHAVARDGRGRGARTIGL